MEADGLFGAPPITVVVGEEAHPTLIKALGLLGFGRKRVVRVPVDGQGRMRADALPPLSGPTIVCVQAGNVNTGAFDPLAAICRADARGGRLGARRRRVRPVGGGRAGPRAPRWPASELADSWATDAHKWLNVPYDSGLAFVRDAEALRAAMAVTAEYLPGARRRAQPVGLHARAVAPRARRRGLGGAALARAARGWRSSSSATAATPRRFAEGLAAAGYEMLNDVVLNQVLVSFGEPATTQRVIAALQADGTCWCGGTVWQGRTAMRISVSSWATTDDDVERSLEAMLRVARDA